MTLMERRKIEARLQALEKEIRAGLETLYKTVDQLTENLDRGHVGGAMTLHVFAAKLDEHMTAYETLASLLQDK